MKADEILLGALGKKTAAERDAFLEGACGGDTALRASVESLLKAHEAAGSFLEKPLFESGDPEPPGAASSRAPRHEGSVLSRLDPSGRIRPRMLLRDTDGDRSPVLLPGGGRTEGRYRLVGEIARGGVGIVHKGQDIDLGRDVALKVLRDEYARNPEMLQRFVEEAQIGGQLQHPGIVPVYELGLGRDGQPFFTMKLVKGRTLASLLTERKDPSQERRKFLGIFEAVCQTMAYAHARGVIHRDLKPSNVMVGAFGEVLVVDWGMGKVLSEGGVADERRARDKSIVATVRSGSPGSHSVAGSVMGTPAYMPPEQARGEVEHVGERSDVFSLGAILVEILSGHAPYAGDSMTQLLKAAEGNLEDAWRRLEECGADPELVKLARECLAPDPLARLRDAGAVAAEITAYLASVEERAKRAQIEAAEATLKAEEERRRRKLTRALAASVMLTMVLGGGGAYWTQETKRTRRAETAGAVEQAIDEATLLRGKAEAGTDVALWKEAVSTAKRAVAISRSRDADEPTRERASRALADLEAEERAAEEHAGRAAKDAALVERLDEIRQSRGEHWDLALQVQETADALREHGIDPRGDDDLSALAQRIRSSPIALDLITALDGWRSHVVANRTELADRLARLLDEADDDPWRARMRSAETVEDLRGLAREADVETMPVHALTTLVVRLGNAGDVAGAVALARRAQALYPDDFWANCLAAWWSYESTPQRLDDALRYYTAAIALRPRSFGAYNCLGLALRAKGDLDGAVVAYREAIRLNPAYALAHSNLGNTLREKGDLDGAVAQCREAIRLKPEFAGGHVNLGSTLYAKGDFAAAATAFREAIRLEPESAEAHRNLGNALRAKGNLDGALAAYREAIRLQPDSAVAYDSLGSLLCDDKGDFAGAVTAFREAIRLKPDYADAYNNLGTALRNSGGLDGAIAAYREAIRLEPDDALAHSNLGVALTAAGDLDGAVAACREAIRLKPEFAKAHMNLGSTLYYKGDFAAAAAALREAIRLRPDNALAHARLGAALKNTGDLDGAVTACREAIRIEPDLAAGHANLGSALYAQGDANGAAAAFREAIRIEPDLALAHFNLGNALQAKGDLDGALAEYREAIRLKPGDADAHCNLGIALRRKGDLDGAIAAYREAIRLQPDSAAAYNSLGSLLCDGKGDFAAAAAAFREAIRLRPDYVQAHCNLGVALRGLGEVEAAIASYREAIRLKPDYPDAHRNLGVALRAKGDLDGAIAAYRELIRLNPDSAPAHSNLGSTLRSAGRFAESLAAFRKWQELDSTRPDRRDALADLVREAERFAALEPRFAGVLAGTDAPSDAEEGACFAKMAYYTSRYQASAALLTRAFRDDPALAEDLAAGRRYNAACAAALAGAGRGKDAPADSKQPPLRAQALKWLRADLALRERQLPGDAATVRQTLENWKKDRDLAGIRDEEEIAKVPEAEREAFRAFWRDVDALLARASGQGSPGTEVK